MRLILGRKWMLTATIVPLLVVAYTLILPLLRPRGIYGWGHYRIWDIALGIPSLLVVLLGLARLLRPGSRLRGFLHKLVLAGCATLLTLLAFDGLNLFLLKGVWRGGSPNDVWFDEVGVTRRHNLPHDDFGFVRKPFLFWKGTGQDGVEVVYRTDENGYRNLPYQTHADLVFVGDSFTEAASVREEDTFVWRTCRTFGLTAINLGRSAYGPQQELLALKEYAPRYHPSIIIWQIFEGNDLSDAARYAIWRDHPPMEPLKLRITKGSLLVRLLSLSQRKQWMTLGSFTESDGTVSGIYLDYPASNDRTLRWPKGYEETVNAIREGFRWTRMLGAEMLIVFIPVKVRVLGPYVVFESAGDQRVWLPEPDDERSDFAVALESVARQEGWAFVDVTASLQERARIDNRRLYASNRDSHLGVQGHHVVSQEIVKWLGPRVGRKTSFTP